ncbi:MAG: chaperone NapD [Gracilibacteraceae bacterium]|jgi:nitrate reductase NapAB chaperone NapD|nr:chaperone NapD [Gracilibacteraceae bacterium]
MAIASLIVKTKQGSEEQATTVINSINGLSVHTVTENQEIVVLAEAPTSDDIFTLSQSLEKADESIVSVLFAYMNIENLSEDDV